MGMLSIRQQGVNHDIADEVYTLLGNALAHQIEVGAALGGVQPIGDLVGEHSVDFLRHGAIVTAQAGFDMHYGNILLGADQSTRQGRIDVPDDHNAGGFVRVENRLEAAHHLGRLHRVSC